MAFRYTASARRGREAVNLVGSVLLFVQVEGCCPPVDLASPLDEMSSFIKGAMSVSLSGWDVA